jgi:hypothetical protein
MDAVEKAFQTQLNNIQAKTGKTLPQLYALAQQSGLSKHGEIRDFYKRELGLGHGDANSLTKFYLAQASGTAAPGAAADASADPAAEIYTGSRAELRPLHDQVMAAIAQLGAFEIAPKKGYLSLRRKKQFATVGPGTKGRLAVGLNLKGLPATERLAAEPPGSMCQYKVLLSGPKEVNKELAGWLKQAYDGAG